jgi:hypothetical protein
MSPGFTLGDFGFLHISSPPTYLNKCLTVSWVNTGFWLCLSAIVRPVFSILVSTIRVPIPAIAPWALSRPTVRSREPTFSAFFALHLLHNPSCFFSAYTIMVDKSSKKYMVYFVPPKMGFGLQPVFGPQPGLFLPTVFPRPLCSGECCHGLYGGRTGIAELLANYWHVDPSQRIFVHGESQRCVHRISCSQAMPQYLDMFFRPS